MAAVEWTARFGRRWAPLRVQTRVRRSPAASRLFQRTQPTRVLLPCRKRTHRLPAIRRGVSTTLPVDRARHAGLEADRHALIGVWMNGVGAVVGYGEPWRHAYPGASSIEIGAIRMMKPA